MGTGRPITDAAVRAGEDLPLFIVLTLSITSGQCIGCDGTHYDVAPDCSLGFFGKRKVVCLKISNVLL